jgi:hypothetical protein
MSTNSITVRLAIPEPIAEAINTEPHTRRNAEKAIEAALLGGSLLAFEDGKPELGIVLGAMFMNVKAEILPQE